MSGAQALGRDARERLLAWARHSLRSYLETGRPPDLAQLGDEPELLAPGGAFVTLHEGHALRGCIGTFEAEHPLAETVRDMAVSAGTRDPRFDSVGLAELAGLHFEISVLTPRRAVAAPLDEIEVGRHGIYVTRGWHRGVLLPQVATEAGWDLPTFLAQTCRKAGLEPDAWRDPRCTVEVFEAQVFGEPGAPAGGEP